MYKKLLAFFTLIILLWFSNIAVAQNMMCGKDLRNTFDAQTLQKLEEAASKIKNGNSRFWKIEKDGVEPSYLFGTMHASDAQIVKMSAAEQAAFDKSSRVALELIDIGDETNGKLWNAIVKNSHLLMYEGDNNIKSQMTEEQFEKFDAVLKKHGIPFSSVERMKPWFFATMFTLPQCPQNDDKALDMQIELNAQDAGKELIGLETIEEQLVALAALPEPIYIAAIIDAVENEDLLKDIFSTMGELYAEGQIAMIIALNDYLVEQKLIVDDLHEYEAILVDKRNVIMTERAKPLLENGNSFIAVGAMHLVGDTGLVEAFRKMGYQVSPMQ